MAKDYTKKPDLSFRLTKDVVVPAGTMFVRAPLERDSGDRIEGIVALGNDATAYLNLPRAVAMIDAKEWFEEGGKDEGQGQTED